MAAFKKKSGRQQVIFAYADVDYTQLVSGTAKGIIELPPGAVILSGAVVVGTAWNSVTSDVLVVGDAGSANRYKTSYSIAATGRTALVPTGYQMTAPGNVNITWTGVGTAPSAGALRLEIEYYVVGRAQFSQGLDA
jgi:hypothetical protein